MACRVLLRKSCQPFVMKGARVVRRKPVCRGKVGDGPIPLVPLGVGTAASGVERGVGRLVQEELAQMEDGGEPPPGLFAVCGLLLTPGQQALSLPGGIVTSIPKPDRVIETGGGQAVAIGAVGHLPDLAVVSGEV